MPTYTSRARAEVSALPAEAPATDAQIIRRTVDLIAARLPSDWSVTGDIPAHIDSPRATGTGMKPAVPFELHTPDGRHRPVFVDVMRDATGLLVTQRALQLHEETRAGDDRSITLLVSRYLNPKLRQFLEQTGLSYADATGNMWINASDPAIFLRDHGSDSDPWRKAGRPRSALNGDPAARIVRTLVDHTRPWGVRDLVKASGASTGSTYRVLEYLQSEGLAERHPRGVWTAPDWQVLLRAWSADYDVYKAATATRCLDPRGVNSFITRASNGEHIRYAVTGSIAASEWAPIAAPKTVFVYVDDTTRALGEWQLYPTETGVNVILLEPKSRHSIAFANTGALESGLTRVAPSQAAVDLLTGPGRSPSEGEALVEWMSAHESAWRRP